jgi:hypothetical protein
MGMGEMGTARAGKPPSLPSSIILDPLPNNIIACAIADLN